MAKNFSDTELLIHNCSLEEQLESIKDSLGSSSSLAQFLESKKVPLLFKFLFCLSRYC